MRTVIAGVVVLVASYLPLLVVGTLDPTSNPVGLGLLTVTGTIVALLLFAVAAIRGIWRGVTVANVLGLCGVLFLLFGIFDIVGP
jgi:hypothetical protein